MAVLAESIGWVFVRGLIAVGDGGRALELELPFCWEDRRRCGGREERDDLSSGAALFWPVMGCFLSFSASTFAFTLCITVNSSCC